MSCPPPKPLALFALHALLLTALIGLWPTPRQAYPQWFHSRASAWFGAFGVEELRVEPSAEAGTDTRLTRLEQGQPLWQSRFSVERLGWWPSAALAALLFATPLSAARRGVALLAGLVLLEAFSLGRLGVEVAYLDLEAALGPGGPPRGPGHLLLRIGSESLTASIPGAAAAFVCWVLVARPRDRIVWRLGGASERRPAESSPPPGPPR